MRHGSHAALTDVSFEVEDAECLAIVGPSGGGKSTLLRALMRMHDAMADVRVTGRVFIDGEATDAPETDAPRLRSRFGWMPQDPNPFPTTIRENVAYGPRLHGYATTAEEESAHVEVCLQEVGLWHEVSARLDAPALTLSLGQQQRLCLARALSTSPEILLLDEPTASIDAAGTAQIEGLILTFRRWMPVLLVTHNLAQARRLGDRIAMMQDGRLVEIGPAEEVVANPRRAETARFLSGLTG